MQRRQIQILLLIGLSKLRSGEQADVEVGSTCNRNVYMYFRAWFRGKVGSAQPGHADIRLLRCQFFFNFAVTPWEGYEATEAILSDSTSRGNGEVAS